MAWTIKIVTTRMLVLNLKILAKIYACRILYAKLINSFKAMNNADLGCLKLLSIQAQIAKLHAHSLKDAGLKMRSVTFLIRIWSISWHKTPLWTRISTKIMLTLNSKTKMTNQTISHWSHWLMEGYIQPYLDLVTRSLCPSWRSCMNIMSYNLMIPSSVF